MEKPCSRCKKVKSFSEYYTRKDRKSGIRPACKECEIVILHSLTRKLQVKKFSLTGKGIYWCIYRRDKDKIVHIKPKDFQAWYDSQEKRCVYCNIEVQDLRINQSPNNRFRLTIDRKDNKRNYDLENLVLACGLCNRIKSNIFTYLEMKEIGDKYLKGKQTWKKDSIDSTTFEKHSNKRGR